MSAEHSLILLVILCAAACGFDLVRRTIPNWLNLTLFMSGALALVLFPPEVSVFSYFGHALIALLAGMLLFKLGVWGGGDAKFYCAGAVWLPISLGPMMALLTAMSGAILVLIAAVLGKLRNKPDWHQELPYAIAITSGLLLTRVVAFF